MVLNETTPAVLGVYAGGGINRFLVTNTGSARMTGLFFEGQATPRSAWTQITNDTPDFVPLNEVLGSSISDGSDSCMQLGPGVYCEVFIDCSRYTAIRVSACGKPGSGATCVVTLPSGFPQDITPLLASPAGAGLVGFQPLNGLYSTDLQGAVGEMFSQATAAQVTASNASQKADNAKTAADAATAATAGSVRYDVAQGLTAPQQAQVRTNIGITSSSSEPPITAGTATQYWRGDKTWQTLDKTAAGLGNVDNTSDANKPVSTAQAAAIALKEPAITAPGTPTSMYWRGDKSWQDLYTNVRAATLTGLSSASTAIAATDSVLVAMGKVEQKVSKGVANGYVGLDSSRRIALPTLSGVYTCYLNNPNTVTATRVLNVPDKDGTIALLSDVSGGAVVLLASDTITAGSTGYANMIFSTAYDHYIIEILHAIPTVADVLGLRLMVSGSQITAGYGTTANTDGAVSTGADSRWPLSASNTLSTNYAGWRIDLMNMNNGVGDAKYALIQGESGDSNNTVVNRFGGHNSIVAAGGFALNWLTSTSFKEACKVRIYGVKNS